MGTLLVGCAEKSVVKELPVKTPDDVPWLLDATSQSNREQSGLL